MTLVYLLSEYPAVNHTYLLAEVAALRAAGFDVRVISISSAKAEHLAPEDRKESENTFYVNGAGAWGFATAHARCAAMQPLRYVSGLLGALRLSGGCPVEALRWGRYFAQAVVAGEAARRAGATHVHSTYCSSVALLLGRVSGLEVSLSIHGSGEFENPGPFRLREKIREAAFVRAISRFGMSQIMKHSDPPEWRKIELARLGVDPKKGAPGRRERSGPFRLLTVGQLAAAKGQHVLLEAMERLVAEGLDVELRLVGDGPLRGSLEERVAASGLAGRVRFEGYRHNAEVLRMYGDADAFVLPSFAEGIPVVLMEAMASGTPCVASRITGIPELIEDGVSGLLVTPADASALAQAIQLLIGDPEKAERMGLAGRRRVEAEYDLASNGRALVEVFERRVTEK